MKSFFDTCTTYFLFNFINYVKLKFVGLNIESKFDKNAQLPIKNLFFIKFNTSLIHKELISPLPVTLVFILAGLPRIEYHHCLTQLHQAIFERCK